MLGNDASVNHVPPVTVVTSDHVTYDLAIYIRTNHDTHTTELSTTTS